MPGVVGVWIAADLPEVTPGLSDFVPAGIKRRGRPILNRDEVNYVGEAYAAVVAETEYQARDAADAITANLDVLPGVGDVTTAIADNAPTVHEGMTSNVALSASYAYGDIPSAFAADSVTARIRLTTARVSGAAIEPRAVTAEPGDGGIKLWTGTQAVFTVRNAVASILDLAQDQVRVIAEDVGGGFGAKGNVFAEEVLTALAAWRLKRPVRWVASRSEDSATTAQGHGSVLELEVSAAPDGKLRGLRGRLLHDIGAYSGSGAGQPNNILPHLISAYVIPAMDIESDLVYTNAVPTGFIRGGGRPLGNFGIERVMDRLARLFVGSSPTGQGHQTMAAQVAADRLGWPLEKIEVTAGDTEHVPLALLTAGSRSAVQVGNATSKAALAMRKHVLERAGEVLEAAADDLMLEDGVITVRGAPARRIPATEVIPEAGLEVLEKFDPARPLTMASGCHVARVAIDPETGHVDVLRYVIAHDVGKAINPAMLHGQIYGGYAHGLGYALHESAVYEADGSFRSASFLDYSIVTSGEVSTPELVRFETPTDSNPEGFKGGGEGGTIPVPAAIAT